MLQVVRYNYSAEERKALVELISYIKNVGSLMHRCDTLVADALWETIHAEVQDFVQNTLATMLRTTFRKKKDLSRWAFLLVVMGSQFLVMRLLVSSMKLLICYIHYKIGAHYCIS